MSTISDMGQYVGLRLLSPQRTKIRNLAVRVNLKLEIYENFAIVVIIDKSSSVK